MGIKEFIAQWNPTEICKKLKHLLADEYRELDLQKVDYLKPQHQATFREIRVDYIDLLNVGRRFCEESILPLQYSIEKLQRRNEINYRQLYQSIEQMDPQPLIRQCKVLEKKITAFNDEIKLDTDYKNLGWKSVAKSVIAGVLVVSTIAASIWLPFLIPIEIAVVTAAAFPFCAAIPGLIHFFKGIAATQLQDDIQALIKKLNQANNDIHNLKKKASEMVVHQGHIRLRVNDEDTMSLLQFYQAVEKDIRDIKEICTESVAFF